MCIYCDSGADHFPGDWFPRAELMGPNPAARDFVEFYDAALRFESDYVFFVDADVFFTDASIVSRYLSAFDDPNIAAVSFLKRAVLPGVYALLCRRESYLTLGPGALAATYEGLAGAGRIPSTADQVSAPPSFSRSRESTSLISHRKLSHLSQTFTAQRCCGYRAKCLQARLANKSSRI